ncbi:MULTISPECIES: hypothetical protein [unclassified Streptomyces]|nr:hypothetical protein [Streptomyces sp. NBC_00228]
MGRVTSELALRLIDDSDADHEQHIVLPATLIPRMTTAPPPGTSGERDTE